MVYACASYVTSWNFIAFLVIAIGLLLIAVIYAISNALPGSTRSKIRGLLRTELMQLFLSGLIIVILIGVTGASCQFTATDPFAFANAYVSNLIGGTNGGLSILTGLYSYFYAYSIASGMLTGIGEYISSYLSGSSGLFCYVSPADVFTACSVPGFDLGIPYGVLSTLYLDFFTPFAIIATGLQFVQFLVLQISQAAAFAILLPIALILRAFSFVGQGLRNAANATLAIAIALYVIFPLTIIFDSYSLNYIYTQCSSTVAPPNCNPAANYLPLPASLPSSGFFSTLTTGGSTGSPTSSSGVNDYMGLSPASGISFFTGSFGTALTLLDPAWAIDVAQVTIVDLSQYLFIAIFMLAINLSITVAFASGLTRALDGGIEGAASFWSNL